MLKKRKKRYLIFIISLLSIIYLCYGCGKKEEKATIRIGSNRALGTITPYMAEKLGYFEDNNINFDILEFSDGTVLMEAMAAGELDMAIVGVVPAAAWRGKGIEIKVIASANGGGHVILTTKQKEIENIKDLKGHKLATPSIGTVADALLRSYILKKEEVSPEEIEIIPGMKPADMGTALLMSNEVDAIMTWEPFASDTELKSDDVQVVFDASEEWKEEREDTSTYPVNVICVTESFLEENKELLQQVLDKIEDTVEYMNHNEEESTKLMSEILSMDKTVISNARKRVKFTYNIDVEAVYTTLYWAYELKYLDNLPEQSELFDLQFLK